MTDEATPYFWASIDNMIEGHRFLKDTLQITPNCSWSLIQELVLKRMSLIFRSVDPFGHGLMVPFLLNLAGIRHMVIGRISNEIKATLRKHHQLHFNWRQAWDTVC
jgi:alpha-mannosidase II